MDSTGISLLIFGIAGIAFFAVERILFEKNRKKQKKLQKQRERHILRDIEKEEKKNYYICLRRLREEVDHLCDLCDRPAVQVKEFNWYKCGHSLIIFACGYCTVPYELPCPFCEERRRYREKVWSDWLWAAAAHVNVRRRRFPFPR